jgi:DNA-binding transcriptional MerR regulator
MGSQSGHPADEALWTLDALTRRVSAALAVDYPGPESGRVRAIPDRRTIRYYGTLGLLDRPAAMRGRTAFYGRRHLLQLVAIKRLQAEGHTLAEVQARLAGLPQSALEAIARVPEAVLATGAEISTEAAPERRPRTAARAFWRDAPTAAPPPAEAGAPVYGTSGPASASARPTPTPMTALELAPGATVLLDATRPLTADDAAALADAAAELLQRLHQRGLLRPLPEKGDPS